MSTPFDLAIFSLNGESTKMKSQLLEDKFVLGKIAILGQATVIYAKPNAGKTLLTLKLLIDAIESEQIDANDVYYVNADDNFKGLTEKLVIAEKYGFHMLSPSHKAFEIKDFKKHMETIIREGNAKGKVIILDTLKKFTDIMQKNIATEFGKLARNFVSHGGTVIALAHTNKHKDTNGKSIYAGTADITEDVDCYYILEELRTHGDSKTIQFENHKNRGDVALKESYSYSAAPHLTYEERLNSIKTLSECEAEAIERIHQLNETLSSNREIIETICQKIKDGITNKTDIIQTVAKITFVSKPKVKSVLEQHTGKDLSKGHRWNVAIGEKNIHFYSLLEVDKARNIFEDLGLCEKTGI